MSVKWHTAEPGSWRWRANEVLRELWDEALKEGRQPTAQEIKDAYPFGMREYTPYKVWLEQVAWFKAGCPAATVAPRVAYTPPREQGALL